MNKYFKKPNSQLPSPPLSPTQPSYQYLSHPFTKTKFPLGVCALVYIVSQWKMLGNPEWREPARKFLGEGLGEKGTLSFLYLGVILLLPDLVFCLFVLFWWLHMPRGILVPWPGIEPRPRQWKRGVLTTGPPGNSPAPPSWTFSLNCPHFKLQVDLFISFISPTTS